MPTLKETVWAISLITLVSAFLMFAVWQLDSSGWAESVRADVAADTQHDDGHESGAPRPAIGPLLFIGVVLGSLAKIAFSLGVPGLITIGILRFTRRKRKRAAAQSA